jgi:hypothetical protein
MDQPRPHSYRSGSHRILSTSEVTLHFAVFRFEFFPEDIQLLEKSSEGFYMVCLRLHSLHMPLIRGFLAQHAHLKSKGHS